jgi:hypothetical protein
VKKNPETVLKNSLKYRSYLLLDPHEKSGKFDLFEKLRNLLKTVPIRLCKLLLSLLIRIKTKFLFSRFILLLLKLFFILKRQYQVILVKIINPRY